jgi:hypothetical protein
MREELPQEGRAHFSQSEQFCTVFSLAHASISHRIRGAIHVAGANPSNITRHFLFGGFSGRFGGYGYGYGHGGVGLIGTLLIVVVVLMLLGRL